MNAVLIAIWACSMVVVKFHHVLFWCFQLYCLATGGFPMAKYYIFIDRQYGPFEFADLYGLLSQRRFNEDCWVFHRGETQDWTRAGDVQSLKPLFQNQEPAPKLKNFRIPELKIPENKPELDTQLVSASKAEAIKALELKIPRAPLSDVPSRSKIVYPSNAQHKAGLLDRIRGVLRL